MIDKILDRYAGRESGNSTNGHDVVEESAVDDFGTFGFLRGSRERATMLELRKKDGNILAVGYGWLEKLEFDGSDGITLHLAGQKIRIKGRNLNREVHPKVRLFEAICRHRVPWIREANEPDNMSARDQDVVVESLTW